MIRLLIPDTEMEMQAMEFKRQFTKTVNILFVEAI